MAISGYSVWSDGTNGQRQKQGGVDLEGWNVLGQISLYEVEDQTDPMYVGVRFTNVYYMEGDIPRQQTINGPVFQQDNVTRVEWIGEASNGDAKWSVVLLQTDL
ncbi:MAG: hypothetical protein ACTHJM_11390 [Marmoricola sp.]